MSGHQGIPGGIELVHWGTHHSLPLKYTLSGLFIGTRGMTIRALEDQTGCKVLIRGYGASKPAGEPPRPDDNDPLHVVLLGEEDGLARAKAIVEEIIERRNESPFLKSLDDPYHVREAR